MTPKERAAMQQALEALEMHAHGVGSIIHTKLAWDALREALAEPDIEEMTLTQIAERHEQAEQKQYPTYGFCPICGSRGISRERRIDGNDTCANGHSYASNLALHIAPEKQAEQEPVAWMNTNGAVNKLREAGWAMNAVPVHQAEQEPVAIAIVTKTKTDASYITNIDLSIAEAGYKLPSGEHSLYAAPVRTKDLMDDEIWEAFETHSSDVIKAVRAVIAAYKEKNK